MDETDRTARKQGNDCKYLPVTRALKKYLCYFCNHCEIPRNGIAATLAVNPEFTDQITLLYLC